MMAALQQRCGNCGSTAPCIILQQSWLQQSSAHKSPARSPRQGTMQGARRTQHTPLQEIPRSLHFRAQPHRATKLSGHQKHTRSCCWRVGTRCTAQHSEHTRALPARLLLQTTAQRRVRQQRLTSVRHQPLAAHALVVTQSEADVPQDKLNKTNVRQCQAGVACAPKP